RCSADLADGMEAKLEAELAYPEMEILKRGDGERVARRLVEGKLKNRTLTVPDRFELCSKRVPCPRFSEETAFLRIRCNRLSLEGKNRCPENDANRGVVIEEIVLLWLHGRQQWGGHGFWLICAGLLELVPQGFIPFRRL